MGRIFWGQEKSGESEMVFDFKKIVACGTQHGNRRSPSKIQSMEGLSTWSQESLQWGPNFILRSRYFQTEI